MKSRRVQKVGPASLAVSLPNDWTKEMEIRKGDLIFFKKESDGSLNLKARLIAEREKNIKEFEIKADLCNQPGMLERIIVSNYLLGHDIIRVISSKPLSKEHKEEIRGIIRKLIGLDIIEEGAMLTILQCSIDPLKFPIDMIIRRLYEIASTIHKESINVLFESNIEIAEEAIRREDDADMMYWLAIRLLYSAQGNKELTEKIGLGKLNILNIAALIGILERMADWGEKIGKSMIKIENQGAGRGLIKEIHRLSEEAFAIHSKAMESIFTGDIELANTAIESYKKFIEQEEEKLVQKLYSYRSDSISVVNLRHILSAINRMAEIGAEIAELSINQALEKPTELCKEISLEV
jgi:phosphate uptake regulator